MTRSATWWLLALAISAGLLGVVLKATDLRRPGEPGDSPRPADEAREAALAPSHAPSAVDVARPGRTSPAPPSAAPAPAASEQWETGPAARDVVRPAPGAGRGELGGARTMPPRRAARERANARRRAESGSLHVGAVGGDPEEALAAGSTRAGGKSAPTAATPSANAAVPDVVPAAPELSFSSGDDQFPTGTPVEVTDVPDLAGASGTLSFWLQPTWGDGNQDDASLLELGDGRLRVVKNVDFLRFEWTDDAGGTGGIGAPIAEWKPGEWHAVTTTWNGTTFALYIDGQLVSEKADAGHVGLPSDATLLIGSNFPESRPVAPGMIGKVDVRRRPLTPGEVANQFAAATGTDRR